MSTAFLLRDDLSADRLSVAEGSEQRNIWSTPIAWILLLPMLYFLTACQMFTPNDPEAFLDSSAAVLNSSGPTGRGPQGLSWVVLLCAMYPCRREILSVFKRMPVLVLLMLLTLASAFWSDSSVGETVRRAVLLDLTIIFGAYLTVRFTPEEQLDLIFGIGAVAVIASFMTAFLDPSLNRGFQGEWKGIYGHKNDLGMYTVFSLSPVFFMKRASSFKVRFFRTAILMGGLLLEALSQSRGGWVLVAVLVGYATTVQVVNKFERRNALWIIGASLPVLGGLAWLFKMYADELAYAVGKDPNLSNRTVIWAAVWPAIMKRPLLGYGYGGFWKGLEGESGTVILKVGMGLVHAHNGVLSLWLQLGLVGVVLSLIVTLRGVWDCLRTLGTSFSKYHLWYGSILLLTIVGSIDESFFFAKNVLTTTLWALACMALHRMASQAEVGPV